MNQPMSDDDDHVTSAAEKLADILRIRKNSELLVTTFPGQIQAKARKKIDDSL